MNRTTNASKTERGTLRADRVAHGPMAGDRLTVTPAAPGHLSERARLEWDNLAPLAVGLGVLTSADLRALELLAETLAQEVELRAVLAVEGVTVQTGSGGSKSHPALKALADTRAASMRLLDSFGLSPKGRQSIDVPPPRAAVNPFSALIKSSRRPKEKS